MTTTPVRSESMNVADRLAAWARTMPDAVAVACANGCDAQRRRIYDRVTFGELDEDADRLARGLVELGVRPGTRLALFVPPRIDFYALTFALFRSGAVAVLIDPGMGLASLLRCLDDAAPDGFISVPRAHAIRTLLAWRYRRARINVTVGRRWFWSGPTLERLRAIGEASRVELPATGADDPAAIIFTSGSTGPAKGVLYRHANFDTQVAELKEFFDIQPGEIDLPCFPLFGLFNAAMGVTSVLADIDPMRPAKVDPKKIIEAVRDWQPTQAFGSPAIWNRVGRYCEQHGVELPTLRRVLAAGAPVASDVMARMKASIDPEGEMHTPYGATEALPIASIAAGVVLRETSWQTDRGAGVCVGHKFPRVEWKVIRAVDGPIASLDGAQELPPTQIGELIVRGPAVTAQYATQVEWNVKSKIPDPEGSWHRMGDVGYLDEQGRFWFCGRLAHRVLTANGPLYTIPCEAIFNRHEAIYRTALVGVGPAERQTPVIVAEPLPGRMPRWAAGRKKLGRELRQLGEQNPLTCRIEHFLLHRSLPVDVRHNAKIVREELAVWAAKRLKLP